MRRRLTLLVSKDGGGEREKTRDDYSCSHNIGMCWLYLLRSAFSLPPSLSVAVPFAVAKDRFIVLVKSFYLLFLSVLLCGYLRALRSTEQ